MSSGIQHLPTGVLTYLIICALPAPESPISGFVVGRPWLSPLPEEAGKWAKEKGKSGGRSSGGGGGRWGGGRGGEEFSEEEMSR